MALATDTRARGPQEPQKYPVQVGTTYLYYGEQPGYIYNPYNDTYVPDPRLATDYFQQAGLAGNPEGIPPNAKPGGRKEPGKYPGTGPNYDRYGEIPGWEYDYLTDTYIPPAPKEASVLDTYGPVAGTGLAIGVGSGLAQDPTAFLGGIKDGLTSIPALFGLGSAPAATAAPAAASAAAPAASVGAMDLASSVPFGLEMGGSAAAAAPATPSLASAGTLAAPGAPEMVGATPGLFGIGGSSPFLTAGGIAAGAATGYEQFRGLQNVAQNDRMKPLEQAALALPTFGLSLAYNPIRDFFGGDGDKWKQERNRLESLRDEGVNIPDAIFSTMPTHGRSRDELENKSVGSDFIGFDSSGNWTNNKFNRSRDLADLRPEDIVGYAAFAEKDPLWFEKPLQDRLNLANVALQAGAVKEHNGTIDVDWDKFDPGAAPGSYSGYAGNPSLTVAPQATSAPTPVAPTQTPMQPRPYIPTPAKPQQQPAQPPGQKNPYWMFQQGALRR